MKDRNWKDIAELIGIVAIVASLVFVGLQMRQTQSIAAAEATSQALLDQIEWINLVNQNREIWTRGNRGDELSEVEMSTYRDLAELRSSLAFFQYRQRERLGRNGEMFVAQYATHIHLNPGARREWTRQSEVYDNYWSKILTEDRSDETVEADSLYEAMLRAKVDELDRLYGK